MIFVVIKKPLKVRFADSIEVEKHLLTDGCRVVQKAVRWTSLSCFAGFFSRRESLNVCQHNQVQFLVGQFQNI